jgi:hypothetical protein
MTLPALSQAAEAFRRHPYPFAATGLIALSLNALGLIHPVLAMVSSIFLLPMLYAGLGTLAEAEPGLHFSQALRLALSAWPRMASLGAMILLMLLLASVVLGVSLSALYGDELLPLATKYQDKPEEFARALISIDWTQSAFGLAALGLLGLALTTLLWMAPMALVYRNLGVFAALKWSLAVGRSHFAFLLPAALLWSVLSVMSAALFGLSIILWPITALFHFFCFRELIKRAG